MANCPYCNAEIEDDLSVCPACGRYLAVTVVPHDQPPGGGGGQPPRFRPVIFYSHGGCGCCVTRLLAGVLIVLGFWFWPCWVAALALLLLEFSPRAGLKG